MKFVQFIWADGRPSREDIAVMNREIPAYDEEMATRGVRLFGRELELPQTAAAVRVRGGETLVSDGPFAETKEFIAGLDLLQCADLDEVIEVTAKNPITRFHPMELRPVVDDLELDEAVVAFGRGEDGDSSPYLLCSWVGRTAAGSAAEPGVVDEVDLWRRNLEAEGVFVLGSALGGMDVTKTVRVRDGETVLSEGSFSRTEDVITGIEVVSCADREHAMQLAAAHPIARHHAIEVRPFYQE